MRASLALGAAGLAALALAAIAEDTGWKALSKRYDELARNHDDEANRERRYVLLDMFPFRTEKPCRKLLKEAWDDEKTVDNRVAVVHLLAGCGDPKAIDFLISGFKKERARAPVLALGLGLGFTPDADRTSVTERAVKHLRRAKDDVRYALIEGLGELGDPAALPWLQDAAKLTPEERFERNVALGRCGGEAVVPLLAEEARDALAVVRLGAARGLAAISGDAAAAELRALLKDPDERVVRRAAAALAMAGRKDAAGEIATALGGVPSLRSREELRAALRTLLERDLGHDAAAWKTLAEGGSPPAPGALPELPAAFGLPVASDRFALVLDTSRSTGWMGRLDRMKEGAAALIASLPEKTSFALAAASHDYRPYSEAWVDDAGRGAALTWIDELQPGGGFDAREALTTILETDAAIDTIVLVTDSHPWGSGRGEGSRETMEIFRRMNRSRDVRLLIALVMPGGRYESSERSESEIVERVDYLAEMAEVSGGRFVHVEE